MTFVKRLTMVSILPVVVLLGISVVVFESIAPIASYAAETLDINTPTLDELKALPGIGEAYSKKITEGRPYRPKDEAGPQEDRSSSQL